MILVFCLYLFTQLLYVFLQDVFTMFSGKLISAVNVLMTTSASLKDDGGVSFLLEVVVATVAFFVVVVVVLLTSPNAMFSFHRYRHNNNKNEIKWLKILYTCLLYTSPSPRDRG